MAKSAADIIRAYNAGREPERLALKMAAMRGNMFSFYRGTAHLFWQRVREAGVAASAPAAWCSGDLHLENFGTYLGDNGLVYFDVNDFDEAALAPCDYEILRFVTSILVAAPVLKIKAAGAKELARVAAESYRTEIALGKARWIERRTATGAIGDLMTGLKKRNQARLLDRRTIAKKGRRKLDLRSGRMLPVTPAERDKLERFTKAVGKASANAAYFGFIDAARRIAGTGSLGVARYVLLIEGEGSPDGNVLLDLKAATPSSLTGVARIKQPAWRDEAERIVAVQRACQAAAPARLQAVTFDSSPFVLKEMQPTADRLDLARIARDPATLADALCTMARLAAWAQLRSAGRDGSANVDALRAFAADAVQFAPRMLVAARDLAAATAADYKVYCRSFDDATQHGKVAKAASE